MRKSSKDKRMFGVKGLRYHIWAKGIILKTSGSIDDIKVFDRNERNHRCLVYIKKVVVLSLTNVS